jgi:hypothetical protein
MFPIHLILIPIIPLLYLVSRPETFLFYNFSVIPFIYLIGVAIILQIVISFFSKNKLKPALVVSWFYLFFFTYGYAHSFLNEIMNGGYSEEAVKNRFLVPLWLGAFVVVSTWILKTKKTLVGLKRFLNVWSITMTSMFLLNVAFYFLNEEKLEMPNFSGSKINRADVGGPIKTPDIYYIIFDGYPNEHTLKERFDYDNSPFLNVLKKRGFYVASKSHSNYALTLYSLYASLNMNYIGQEFFKNTHQLNYNDNNVTRFLKDRGYKIINITAGYRIGKKNRIADLEIKCDQISEVVSVLIRYSLYYPFEKHLHLIGNSERQQTLCLFDRLGEIANRQSPKFIVGHVKIPVADYLFGPNGENVLHEVSKKAYLGQVIFANKKIMTMVDKILKQSDSQPIIIIQSDHGPGFPYVLPNLAMPPDDDIEFRRDRMRNLSAYLLPEKDNEMVYPTISNVNTFRVIFNLYFNTSYKLLEDKSYYSYGQDAYLLSEEIEEIDPYVD